MRDIKYIVLHTTATPQSTTIESIQNYWKKELGWKMPGYHYIIKPDGTIVNLLSIDKVSNGVAGYNTNSIHISYIGGIDKNGKALDNRSENQKCAQISLLKEFKKQFPKAEIKGHRDFLQKGSSNWKDCPSFDVATWLKNVYL